MGIPEKRLQIQQVFVEAKRCRLIGLAIIN